jgi:hypothetical protein
MIYKYGPPYTVELLMKYAAPHGASTINAANQMLNNINMPYYTILYNKFNNLTGFDYFISYELPPPPYVQPSPPLPTMTTIQYNSLKEIIKSLEELIGDGYNTLDNAAYNTTLTQFKQITGIDYYPGYIIPSPPPSPPLPTLTSSQITLLTPIVSEIKDLELAGHVPQESTNPAFNNKLQQFKDISNFDYFTGYNLPSNSSGGAKNNIRKYKNHKKTRKNKIKYRTKRYTRYVNKVNLD